MAQSETPTWDIPTRLIHWALAILVVLNLFILEEGDDPHQWVGYAAAGLIAFRLLYGIVVGNASSLSQMVFSKADWGYFISNHGRDPEQRFPAHNPAASITYVFIWLFVLALAGTGWLSETDAFWGEEWLQELHEGLATALMVATGLHLLGIMHDSWKNKRRSYMGMVSGRRS